MFAATRGNSIVRSTISVRLQKNAKHPETFGPDTISIPSYHYISMTEAWKLPFRAIECSNAISVLFWSSLDEAEENPHLRLYSLRLIYSTVPWLTREHHDRDDFSKIRHTKEGAYKRLGIMSESRNKNWSYKGFL
ncbi:hypothetical protein NHQ30_002014 [Ciborinia camelliae]|nr:hypothetical protein NHQ30_002014 [Ciborinia camelliae]